MRHDLGNRGAGHVFVQVRNEGADGVVEFEAPLFAEEHESGGSEGL
jgi:hypothetical protein